MQDSNRVAVRVVMVVARAVTVAARVVVTAVDSEVRLATPAADTDTCLATAPRDRNATTVARLAIFPVIAHLRPQASARATSASSQVTSRLNALTKPEFIVDTAEITMRRFHISRRL